MRQSIVYSSIKQGSKNSERYNRLLVVVGYAPMSAVNDHFYIKPFVQLRKVKRTDIVIVVGNFNHLVGSLKK